MEAAIAGFYGVPLILLLVIRKGRRDRKPLGDVPTVTVKWAVNETVPYVFLLK